MKWQTIYDITICEWFELLDVVGKTKLKLIADRRWSLSYAFHLKQIIVAGLLRALHEFISFETVVAKWESFGVIIYASFNSFSGRWKKFILSHIVSENSTNYLRKFRAIFRNIFEYLVEICCGDNNFFNNYLVTGPRCPRCLEAPRTPRAPLATSGT